MQYRGSKPTKNSNFWEKNSKIFRSPRMVWNGLCAKKKHSKVIFVDFILFEQVGPNNSVSEIVWNKSKSCQKQFLLTIHSFANVQCDVESFSFILLYTCVTMYVFIKTSPYICLHVFKIVLFMYEWTIERKERMKILCIKLCVFMYIIMKVYMKVYICL